ncbi:ABC transporter substrate-binding protein [Desulfomonile tiedjei]|uniref:Amino acid/amide ABC transporter substrate-binding protein, HAAT family n=1 Tax=Desulfomonile tiedjei (strain ATCC 49306 / DSM 6799 / DCB-1) TaxID=706587 RepID=I4CDK5_DESTA|nr:ABC transporter substrate-binding protein [Desulfomonile tiedjei]AFM27646.1 amino acid/amide ABC transporter substrate-binding protein, HAAT family [Desulfomonile tiedjei DSM 6799]
MRIFLSALTICLMVACRVSTLESISIGICLPITGHFSTRGQSAWEGIKVAHAMEPHVLGKPVQLRLINTGSDPAGATNTALAAIEKNAAVALIGDIFSVNRVSISHCTEKRGIPVVTIPDPRMPQSTGNHALKPCSSDMEQASVAANLAIRHFSVRTAAVIYDISQEHSICLAAHFAKEFRQAGGRIVAEIRCRIGDRDFAGQINRIKLANPDILYLPIYHVECALLIRQARESAISVPVMATDAVQVPEFLELGGKAMESVVFTPYFREDFFKTESGKRFPVCYENRKGNKPQPCEALAAESYFLVLDAIKRARSCDPRNIREALATGPNDKPCVSENGQSSKPAHPLVGIVRRGTFTHFSNAHAWVGTAKDTRNPESITESSRLQDGSRVSTD